MSRRTLLAWGWDLDGWDFANAVAALGVLTPVLQERGQLGARRRRVRRRPARIRGTSSLAGNGDQLRLLLDEVSRSTGPLVWDLTPLGPNRDQRSAVLTGLPAAWLADAWSSSIARWRTLEARPVRWLDPAWVLETLSSAVAVGSPYIPLPERTNRLRWSWPLSVGFLADPTLGWLRDSLYEGQPGYLADLTEPQTNPSQCDFLLIPQDVPGAIEALDRAPSAPDATVVLLLSDARPFQRLDRAAELAARLRAWGVAVVRTPESRDWYRAFIRELSHARPLLHCLPVVGAVAAVFAAPSLAQAAPLPQAASVLATRMERAEEPVPAALSLAPSTTETLGIVDRPAGVGEVGRRLLATHLAFDSERGGATHIANVSRAARPVLEEAERSQAPLRFIRAQVYDSSREGRPQLHRGFRAGATHEVAVSIGPRDEAWLTGDQPFPVQRLPPDPSGHRLTVVFAEPNLLGPPLMGTVELPPFGPSDAAVFPLPVKRQASAVEARISVLHRGRILQTALLRGQVISAAGFDRLEEADEGPRIQILIEAVLWPGTAGLDRRRRFQTAVVLNHDQKGRQSATLIGGRKAAILRLDQAAKAVAEVGKTFERAERDNAFGRKLGSKTSLGYLRRLALHGRTLYLRAGKPIEATFAEDGPLERIQLLSANPNTFLPVEVIYDLPPPVAEPKLCRNWPSALNNGRCDPTTFHQEDEEGHLDVVCPAGFWGISKIIERQAVNPDRLTEDPETRGIDFAAFAAPVGNCTTLGGFAPILFAASEHINDVQPTELQRVVTSLRKLADGKLLSVETWKAWAHQVKAAGPPLLLLLSHTELYAPNGAALEIAKKTAPERRVVAEITKHHVNLNPDHPGPIVMLLGCTTAVPQDDFQSFVVQFKEMGASLVVGTIAPVLGRHAGRVAEALVEKLLATTSVTGRTGQGAVFGDAMLAIRRELLAKGVLMSLCLTAYGDADWRIPASG